jgi:hypothetical protein
MKKKLIEIHTTQSDNIVKVTYIEGPKRKDLNSGKGFFVTGNGVLFLASPGRRPLGVLKVGMQRSEEWVKRKIDFISEKVAELCSKKEQRDVPIERNKEILSPESFIEREFSKDVFLMPGEAFHQGINNWLITNEVKVKPSNKRMKQLRKNTGIQITISDDLFPIVTHIQALTRKELPSAYLNSYLPKVWLFKNKLFSELGCVLLEKNEEKPYSRQEISAALLHIRLAGEHLAAVNKHKELYLSYRQAATFKDGKLT